MKLVFSALIGLALATSLGLAQAKAGASTLATTMRAMSTDLKTIATQAGDASKNASSAQLAADFVTQVENSKAFVPDSISSLPQADQAARLQIFQDMLEATAAQGRLLQAAFQNNQNADVPAILAKLTQNRNDGHKEFKQ